MRLDSLERPLVALGLSLFLAGCTSDNNGTLVTYEPDGPDDPPGPLNPPGVIVDTIPPVGPAVYSSTDFEVVPILTDISRPWGMAFLPGGAILVTERDSGRLWLVRDGARSDQPVAGVPDVRPQGQGGLLDVALHPDFESTGWVYVSYASWTPSGNGTTAVARGRLEDGALVGTEEIFVAQVSEVPIDAHFGSRLAFDHDGFLWVTIGDRRMPEGAQNPATHNGTIVRLRDDGTVPEDNPFVDEPATLASVFAYGVRNPQGLTVHPESGQVYWSEHGPLGGDEVNRARAGANYGWPAITHGRNYDGSPVSESTEAPGMEQPLIHWEPSIAPSGLTFYSGSAFPEWTGDLFAGALAARTLVRMRMEDGVVTGEERVLSEEWGLRVRDVRDGPDGFLYILTDEVPGGIYRLQPTTD